MAYRGGLRKWFAEDWRDVKTGKKCGRSGKKTNEGIKFADKTIRKYPKSASAVGGAIAFDIFDDA